MRHGSNHKFNEHRHSEYKQLIKERLSKIETSIEVSNFMPDWEL